MDGKRERMEGARGWRDSSCCCCCSLLLARSDTEAILAAYIGAGGLVALAPLGFVFFPFFFFSSGVAPFSEYSVRVGVKARALAPPGRICCFWFWCTSGGRDDRDGVYSK